MNVIKQSGVKAGVVTGTLQSERKFPLLSNVKRLAPLLIHSHFICIVYVSESSMYLPVTPVMSKHRKSLNLLEVPHPQHGSHAKQHKVGTEQISPRSSFVSYVTLL